MEKLRSKLDNIEISLIKDLTEAQATELQSILLKLGYYQGQVTGIIDDVTKQAFSWFKKDYGYYDMPNVIGSSSIKMLKLQEQKLEANHRALEN